MFFFFFGASKPIQTQSPFPFSEIYPPSLPEAELDQQEITSQLPSSWLCLGPERSLGSIVSASAASGYQVSLSSLNSSPEGSPGLWGSGNGFPAALCFWRINSACSSFQLFLPWGGSHRGECFVQTPYAQFLRLAPDCPPAGAGSHHLPDGSTADLCALSIYHI